ncbi:MAG: gliding motility protein GldL [Prevotella sp.]|nr:gliding motility protein GldL [Prevotella sp.]
MTKYSKFNIVYRLQKWMDSVPGQTFLNYAYSWGAAIVILGTLFKLTHIPGANFWLFLGMGTEVVVFFLSAFDRPFDKTTDGMELARHAGEDIENEEGAAEAEHKPEMVVSGATGGTIIIGGGGTSANRAAAGQVAESGMSGVTGQSGQVEVSGIAGNAVVAAAEPIVAPPLTPDMTEATNAYVDELKKLTEVLERVSEQSRRLTTDSEEMENLNRTLTGICKVYEMQLKSASSQIGTIDEINEQTRKMAGQIAELNKIYKRMIEAMTVNMPLGVKPTTE